MTVLSHALLSTVLDFWLEISFGSHANNVDEAQNNSQTFLLSLFQIRSNTDLAALIEHKAGIYGPRPQSNTFESLKTLDNPGLLRYL